MKPAQKQSAYKSRSFIVLALLAWIVLLAVLGYNRQGIEDWWRLRHYQVPATVAQFASDDTLTAKARHILYVNHPQIQAKANFVECNLGTEQAAVLGCYHSDQAGIFVLSVSDYRLNGIEQVTTAHEMLHAAYDRLSAKQKQKVDGLLEDYYKHDLHDPTILAQMADYQKTEPKEVVNEMHSVFGTEVGNLPPALETYYRQYFTNRAKIVGYYNAYQGEFTSRQAIIKTDDAQLAGLKKQIDSTESSLQTQYTALTSLQGQLNAEKRSGDIRDYNSGVPGYNSQVDAYNSAVSGVQTLIAQYNQLVTTRNTVAIETQQLTNEISSNVSPIGN